MVVDQPTPAGVPAPHELSPSGPSLDQARRSLQLAAWYCALRRHQRLADLLELCDEQARVAAMLQASGIYPAFAVLPIERLRAALDGLVPTWPHDSPGLIGRYMRLHAKLWHFLPTV